MRGWKVSWDSFLHALTNVLTSTHTRDMTNASALITTVAELCALPELTSITDSDGRTVTKQSSGRQTTNINWICWESEGVRLHSNDVTLPAVVAVAA